ncbi:serine/threonine-protein kinase [Nannocystis punicea]|uniref:Serine/threonine-protein kinase n=1 Tax=Nannocystis punicea TaxID=2995304 RepID=A0ABY7GVV0_9BACT|nr:serine/threonine-protein kinase [Nannocystis poenicansa]WAS91024.1 serine/threonine-protein kinase [Nannocystis poenicansa]
MDGKQEHTWPSLERLGAEKRDLADEAMYRSLKSKLFDEAYPPVQIGRFRVVQALGQGGMGVVYAAQDVQLDRLVAIKVIRDDRLREGAKDRARLLREARMQAKLAHQNVVPIHEVSEYEGGVFIVMELVKGSTLREWLDREPRPLAAILERFVEAARGLAAAHRAGIVHRDFKLANALVGEDGRVRIADFGLAVAHQSAPETEPERAAGPASAASTSKYAGTPTYMSPEQALGRECDARSDQYSFAVALTEAVLRRAPAPALERLAERTAPALPADGPAPQWLRQALSRALSLDPADRYPSMAALIDVLVESPRRRRRRALAVGLVAALTGATALGATLFTDSSQPQCAQSDERIRSIWNEARRQSLHAAFTATGLPYAEASWRRAGAALDAYAERWAEVARINCEATDASTPQLDRLFAQGAACLDRQRSAFVTLLDQFAAADAGLVAGADTAIAGLPPPMQCRVSPTMRMDDRPAGPTDPRVRELLDRGKILMNTQRGRDAAALLDNALPEIRSTSDVAGEAEALLLLGRTQGRLLGDGPAAARSLHQAYNRANTAKQSDLKWEIWNELARVHAVVFDAPGEARTWLDHAKSETHPDSRAAEAAIAAVESDILIAENRPADAVGLRRSALATLKSIHPPDHPEVVLALRSLAAGLGEARQVQEARDLNVQLLADLQKEYGREHPWPARVELDLGLDLLELERPAAAREHLEHARAALVTTYGEVHLWVAKAEVALAQLDLAEGELASAIVRAEKALAAYDALVPRAHVERVMALVLLTDAHWSSGRTDRLLAISRELLDIHDADPTHSGVDVAGVLTNIGDSLCLLGRCTEALPYFNRLMALYLEDSPPEPALRAVPLRGIGLVHGAKGQPELALAFLEQALEILEKSPLERGGMSDILAATMRELADTLTALRRDPERVRQLRRRAAEIDPQ